MKKEYDNDYGFADKEAFNQALIDNTPYNPEFYIKNKGMLINFISYYESCKKGLTQ